GDERGDRGCVVERGRAYGELVHDDPRIGSPTVEASGKKDAAHIDKDWTVERRLIDGVKTRDVRNIVTANGITTELYRPDWGIVDGTVQQAIHVSLRARAVSAWHQHRNRWDFLFVVGGH